MSELWIEHISHSQLTMAQECPYQWWLLKVAAVQQEANGFAQAGTLAHELLAGWARGELTKDDLALQWISRFPKEVTAPFPRYLEAKGYAAKLFDSVLTYFEGFDGFPGFEIIGVEKEFVSSIAGERFIGVIDLILRNKETGGIMLVDHKSCSLSSFRKNKEQMYRQLLLYSKYTADEFGAFPETLCFNLFKENAKDARQFDPEDYMAARIWAETVIGEMKRRDLTEWFTVNPEYFRCTNLCAARNECRYGNPDNHRKESSIGRKTAIVATTLSAANDP